MTQPSGNREVIYAGSVKNVRADTADTFLFEFTDQVSVFDWGALPDLIPGKGKALVNLGALFFEALQSPARWKEWYAHCGRIAWVQEYPKQGIKTHYRGIVDDCLRVQKVKVIRQQKPREPLELIPLEVVFRFKLVPGSSILKRRSDLHVGDTFSKPLIEFFTKLEPQDRFLPPEEALLISGLTPEKFKELERTTQLVASFLQFTFERLDHGNGGIELIDGKLEWALGADGDLMLVDSIGPDELRLLKDGRDLSKETLREFYRTTDWYQELNTVKERAVKEKDAHWKEKVKTPVPRIPHAIQTQVANAYTHLAQDLKKCLETPIHGERVILIGSGGREHALAYRMLLSPTCTSLIWPTQNQAAIQNLKALFPNKTITAWDEVPAAGDLKSLAERARAEKVTLAVVGPDAYLEAGASDCFLSAGIPCFGPTRDAAKLEWSKSFAKAVMQASGVPTAKSWTLESVAYLRSHLSTLDWKQKWVLKVDTLAAGKGVEICSSLAEAQAGAERLSKLGTKFVVEEFLHGKEVSLFAFCDGEHASLFQPARDFKTLNDDHTGPNTGGMGAITPVTDLPLMVMSTALDQVFRPILREMKKRGTPYQGLLYAGLMVSQDRYWVLEFNARFGDPETQALLPRFKGDFLMWLKASALGKLDALPAIAPFVDETAVYVVAAAKGYPDAPVKGDSISGLDAWLSAESPHGFISGVGANGQTFTTLGGRVLGALGMAADPQAATARAYSRLQEIKFKDMHFRTDVGPARKKIVVLASGRGSNFEALARAVQEKELNAKMVGMICNRKDALVFEKAKHHQVPSFLCLKEQDVLNTLQTLRPDYIVLAGYDRIISTAFIDAFRDQDGRSRIINIHPSLLPDFKGLNAYEAAFKAGVKKTGVSIHRVEPELDSGPLLAQKEFSISDCKSAEEVEARGLEIEHELYPHTLAKLFREEF